MGQSELGLQFIKSKPNSEQTSWTTSLWAKLGQAIPSPNGPFRAGSQANPKASAQLDTITQLSIHIISPVLLTKNVPLGALDFVGRLNTVVALFYLFKVRLRGPMLPIICFTQWNLHASSNYFKRKFGGNQLLHGSISLSPLYSSQTNDLHANIAHA